MPMPPKNSARRPASVLFLLLAAGVGATAWRTPHFGQISALTLIASPHSEQNFSSSPLVRTSFIWQTSLLFVSFLPPPIVYSVYVASLLNRRARRPAETIVA